MGPEDDQRHQEGDDRGLACTDEDRDQWRAGRCDQGRERGNARDQEGHQPEGAGGKAQKGGKADERAKEGGHAFAAFVRGCGSLDPAGGGNKEEEEAKSKEKSLKKVESDDNLDVELAEEAFEDVAAELESLKAVEGGTEGTTPAAVSNVMEKMLKLSEEQQELETAELARRFENLEHEV